MDGKMARARRENDEKSQHNRVSTRKVKKRGEEGFLFIPQEAKVKCTWINPSVSLREIEQISRKGTPSRV
jgi:hypothetical protein